MTWFGVPPAGLDMFHVGIVVPDVRAAMEKYSEALGFSFCEPWASTMDVAVDGHAREVRLAATYSTQGPPYLELVEELSGGVWAPDALGLDHVGLWTDDLAGTVRRLESAGLPARVRHRPGEPERARFSYHSAGPGVWWELVSRRAERGLMAQLSRGPAGDRPAEPSRG